MTAQHTSLRDEILYVIGRSTIALNSSEIYERCTLADEMKQVSNAIWQLKDAKKIKAVDSEGRARYILGDGIAAPVPAGKAGRPAETATPAPAAAQAEPVTGIRPAAEPGLPVLDIPNFGDPRAKGRVEAAHRRATSGAGKAAETPAPVRPDPVAGLFDERVEDLAAGSNAERLADAILARLKRQLAPTLCEMEAAAGLDRLNVHIHIEQIDFHLGGL